ncbi:chaperone modulatory protein CbpM|uniref:Chaperone modulatory protein CbpM n=1 Tax=Brenneria salicis ATCC 15712 = DSM 30166 TaxID=714314 RepID=A0A366I3J3_9GAMM|nr:chaperone modulator CbpM [Brenneria salicis]NMN92726.1 chaperone modulatory protein CbpM [Brenneria salicis ATCC 15712 = DSM 30166]RBP62434.1 chaperone modulatory protein CbpM [Brenneria salicis ATCC 15712 = DSM 30166]RLM30633.1 chaperone-modulator protein CbpM [Brenneria salicis ATCC 15712 = DSM 30166]
MMAQEMTFTVVELCQCVEITQEELIEVVGLGVIVPLEPDESHWRFDDSALTCLRRAQRLQIELDLDWPGVAMTLTLLDQLEELKRENQQLRRQLERFMMTS